MSALTIPQSRFQDIENASQGFLNATGGVEMFAPGIVSPVDFDPRLAEFADRLDAIAADEGFENAEAMMFEFDGLVADQMDDATGADEFADAKGETVGNDGNVLRVVLNVTRTTPPGTLPTPIQFWGSLVNIGTIIPATGDRVFDPGGPNELVMSSAVQNTNTNFIEQMVFAAPALIKRIRVGVEKSEQFYQPWDIARTEINGQKIQRPLPIAQQIDPYQFQGNILDVKVEQIFDNVTTLGTTILADVNSVSYTFDIVARTSLRDGVKGGSDVWKSPSGKKPVTPRQAQAKRGVTRGLQALKNSGKRMPIGQALQMGRSIQQMRTGKGGGFRRAGQ